MSLITIVFVFLFSQNVFSLPAFPGAEGYGAKATGGRGGSVIIVSNLNSSGPGSLQWAVEQPGPRIVVFAVSGVIQGDVTIPHGDLTLAGETAPGGGITLDGRLWTRYNNSVRNIIVRFLRIRPTTLSGTQGDAIQFSRGGLFIFDHITVSWGSDETVDLYEADSITFQWSRIENSATYAGHPDGNFHNYGLISGPDGGPVSIHHNLFANHRHRTPAVANGPSDIVNNFVYNSITGFVHHNPANDQGFNIIGNYYRTGPDSRDINPFFFDDESRPWGAYFVHNNYIDDPGDFEGVLENPWTNQSYQGIYYPTLLEKTRATVAFNTPAISESEVEAVPSLILSQAGAQPNDALSISINNGIENYSGSWGRFVPSDLFEGLEMDVAPTDTDQDGMPDEWELINGMNPLLNDAMNDNNGNGYRNIEEYLHFCANQKLSHFESPTSSIILPKNRHSPKREQMKSFNLKGQQSNSLLR